MFPMGWREVIFIYGVPVAYIAGIFWMTYIVYSTPVAIVFSPIDGIEHDLGTLDVTP